MFFKVPKTASLKELRIDPWPIIDMVKPGEIVVILRKNRPVFVMVTVEEWNAACDQANRLPVQDEATGKPTP